MTNADNNSIIRYMRSTQNRRDSQMDDPIGVYPVKCVLCGVEQHITAPAVGLLAWQNGELIQNALPELSDDDRELLISHICPKCFSMMYYE